MDHRVLFLNASNMKQFPVYPYAFIQVPAVARQHSIHVDCKDLLGIDKTSWAETIQSLIDQHQPEMILITLRNTDSLTLEDYQLDHDAESTDERYFPIEHTKTLIDTIRSVSDLKIVVGGFAFALLARELMAYLQPDFGVVYGPDAFFANFEDILHGKLEDTSNLLYYQDGELVANPVRLFAPLPEPEYTPEDIRMMKAFYDAFPSPAFIGGPVEINRGCSHKCVFCAEPFGKGSEVRYRSLPAIMADIRMLAAHDIRKVYMISSELNPEGNEFILKLADEIYALNQTQPEGKSITWFGANYLMKFSYEEFLRLIRSGFTGGWFDMTALDDQNARTMKTPYRNDRLIGHLKGYAQAERVRQVAQQEVDTPEEAIFRWSMFLGNPAATVETIRNTLETANREGLTQEFSSCSLFTVMRVFDYEELDEAALEVTYSITPRLEKTAYNQLLPSFAYPPALLKEFGSPEEIERLFKYLSSTFLSTRYQITRDWLAFLQENAEAPAVTGWMETASISVEDVPINLAELFGPVPESDQTKALWENIAGDFVQTLIFSGMDEFSGLLDVLGLPGSKEALEKATPYALALDLLERYESEESLYAKAVELSGTELDEKLAGYFLFCVRAVLHRFNLKFSAHVRRILMG